mmetsp:Transcript_51319/g.115647  ORF Transcript_51319/g.115647 Transcript_51319/m.115647 type:complete len:210 (+) Transcript_51319:48-677(+)
MHSRHMRLCRLRIRRPSRVPCSTLHGLSHLPFLHLCHLCAHDPFQDLSRHCPSSLGCGDRHDPTLLCPYHLACRLCHHPNPFPWVSHHPCLHLCRHPSIDLHPSSLLYPPCPRLCHPSTHPCHSQNWRHPSLRLDSDPSTRLCCDNSSWPSRHLVSLVELCHPAPHPHPRSHHGEVVALQSPLQRLARASVLHHSSSPLRLTSAGPHRS